MGAKRRRVSTYDFRGSRAAFHSATARSAQNLNRAEDIAEKRVDDVEQSGGQADLLEASSRACWSCSRFKFHSRHCRNSGNHSEDGKDGGRLHLGVGMKRKIEL